MTRRTERGPRDPPPDGFLLLGIQIRGWGRWGHQRWRRGGGGVGGHAGGGTQWRKASPLCRAVD
jgi:hypothetical protein